jgi:hypothetical protein
MLKKSLLAITMLAALSAAAQAGSTISDKSYWPGEARRTTQVGVSPASQRDLNSAFASDPTTSVYEPSTPAIAGRPAWRYQGGPKSH